MSVCRPKPSKRMGPGSKPRAAIKGTSVDTGNAHTLVRTYGAVIVTVRTDSRNDRDTWYHAVRDTGCKIVHMTESGRDGGIGIGERMKGCSVCHGRPLVKQCGSCNGTGKVHDEHGHCYSSWYLIMGMPTDKDKPDSQFDSLEACLDMAYSVIMSVEAPMSARVGQQACGTGPEKVRTYRPSNVLESGTGIRPSVNAIADDTTFSLDDVSKAKRPSPVSATQYESNDEGRIASAHTNTPRTQA